MQSPHNNPGKTGRHSPIETEIICGVIDPHSGHRVFKTYIDYFEQEVEVFTAACDPSQSLLFRPSLIAKRLQCPTSRIGMFLNRKKALLDGIFQATGFQEKLLGTAGLKSGAYFISQHVCDTIQLSFAARDSSRKSSGGPPKKRPRLGEPTLLPYPLTLLPVQQHYHPAAHPRYHALPTSTRSPSFSPKLDILGAAAQEISDQMRSFKLDSSTLEYEEFIPSGDEHE